MAASRLLAVNQSSGGGDFLLLAIAGPVIAGTSLFGGRGSVWHALLGALVITLDLERDGPPGARDVDQVHRHRSGAAPGRDDRRDRAQPEAGGGTGLTPLRVGLIGYGLAGSAFHAPLVEAVPGLALASIVTSNRNARRRRAPPTRTHGSCRRPTSCSPRRTRTTSRWSRRPTGITSPLALGAVEAGLHVVVDKPLAPNVAEAQRLAEAAAARGVVASVFHNRRWDGDFLTLRRLVAEGALGEPLRLESRFDRWRPEVDRASGAREAGPRTRAGCCSTSARI